MTAERRRLCIVSPYLHGGGAEYQISLLIEALRESGRYDLYYLAHHVQGDAHLVACQVVRIGRNDLVPRLGYVMDLVPLYSALRRIAPHVIYQRVGCGYTGICALYAHRFSVPLIWHVAHDTDVMPESLDRGRNLLRRMLEKWSIRYGISHAASIVVQTRRQQDLLLRHYGRRAAAVIANFHGESTSVIDKSGTPTVVWIANLKPWKRPEVFVRLASALKDVAGVKFLMVGEAPAGEQNEAWWRTLQQDIRATPNLGYVGARTQEEVNTILATSFVYVNTSVREGFPNTFIQAWQREAVVVSLDVDPDDVLEKEGIGICAGNELRLEQTVRRLLADGDFRRGLANRALAHVTAKHSLGNARTLVRLINSRVDTDDGRRHAS